MKLHSGLDARQLMQMLGDALIREKSQWVPGGYKTDVQSDLISGGQRDNVITWILSLNARFHFSPETLALCISMIDRFLQLVKVKPKYLRCIAISCFYIAAKTLEEDEVIPGTIDLVKTSQCGYSVAEILRMEAIILQKLDWNIRAVTPVDFLHIIHAMLVCYYPQLLSGLHHMTPSRHLALLSKNLFVCLCHHQLAVGFCPITLALAVISLDLEQITPSWLTIITMIQQTVEVEVEHLIRCREGVGLVLMKQNLLRMPMAPTSSALKRVKSVKRKAADVNIEEDVYDDIKRLYSEDGGLEVSSRGMACGTEIGQSNDVDSYSLQAVSAKC
ncbi:hypothetical protein ACJMK2_032985 [Sinanodonta woodiana]|uniref:Cyclin-like domain-containing protein n=1 Tax=Sinanodonta woodiana TaxID=1069815 RepID=A0ABD3X4Y5_SINWO